MFNINMDDVISIIRDVANTEILPRFKQLDEKDIETKIGNDKVTTADKRSEEELTRRLSALLPGSKVLGEEAFFENHGLIDLFSGNDPVWIIDPIDGTNNFVANKPLFAVIVSLTHKNETLAGWIYYPITGECIVAEKGSGAYLKGQKLAVLEPDFLDKMAGTGYQLMEAYEEARKNPTDQLLSGPKFDPIVLSLAHEYARLVTKPPAFGNDGRQWHFLALQTYCTPWDNAAGVLIHQEAGGYAAHWDGSPHKPSAYGKGLLHAPDKSSWDAIKRWAGLFANLTP